MRASSDPTPWRPGNTGGGKGPYFRCAFEEGEDEVIDDELHGMRARAGALCYRVPDGAPEAIAKESCCRNSRFRFQAG